MFYQNYCIITNKIGFYAKEPYSPLKPHVAIIVFAWGHVEYVMYSWHYFVDYSEYYEEGDNYDDAEE